MLAVENNDVQYQKTLICFDSSMVGYLYFPQPSIYIWFLWKIK